MGSWCLYGTHVVQPFVQAVQEMNRQTGANVDPNQDPSEMMNSNTRGLMNAVHQLPVLVERKRTIEKHSSLLHALLKVALLPMLQSWSEELHQPSILKSPGSYVDVDFTMHTCLGPDSCVATERHPCQPA